ncbi:MAG: TetR/AcrR family transcriptional regulator [Actinomycetia bacterium]|nr:TetR/AcrR family transcriptional regulator [Actinomycetes bacterium]MCP4961077.1 TetR/AcrR family transcriptional regulator [Actinomycetes bacterium]
MSPYHHGDLKPALLAAAREILETDGTAGLGLRRIARDVGVSHAAPYRHFSDHTSLLASLASSGFDELAETFVAATNADVEHGDDLLRLGGRAYVDFGVENPAMFSLMFSHHDEALFEQLRPSYEAAYAVFVWFIDSAIARGGLATSDAQTAAAAAWSSVHGLVILITEGHLPETPDIGAVIEVCLSGLLARR